MSTRLTPVEPLEIARIRDAVDEEREPVPGRAWITVLLALAVAIGAVVAASLDTSDRVGPGQVLSAALVVLWSACAAFVAIRRPDEPLGRVMLLLAGAGLAAVGGAVALGRDGSDADVAAAFRALGVALLPAAIATHIAIGLPAGRLKGAGSRGAVIASYLMSISLAVYLYSERPDVPAGALVAVVVVDALIALCGFLAHGQRAPLDRAAPVPVAGLGRAPWRWRSRSSSRSSTRSSSGPSPCSRSRSVRLRSCPCRSPSAPRRRSRSGSTGCSCTRSCSPASSALVGVSYLLVVLGLGREPDGDEQTLLGLSMLAAAVAALLWVPARERLTDFATRRVYGERHAPDEVLRTFGSRLTRALPLDELLLQLAESLKKTMALDVAEVWTRASGGRLERAVSVPDRGPAELVLGARGGAGRRARRRVGSGVGARVAARARSRRRRTSRCCASRRSRTRASCSA